jgi:hypothetical protein
MSTEEGTERHWDPQPGDEQRIRDHLLRQRGLDSLREVRLDTGRVVRVGEDAEGEGYE